MTSDFKPGTNQRWRASNRWTLKKTLIPPRSQTLFAPGSSSSSSRRRSRLSEPALPSWVPTSRWWAAWWTMMWLPNKKMQLWRLTWRGVRCPKRSRKRAPWPISRFSGRSASTTRTCPTLSKRITMIWTGVLYQRKQRKENTHMKLISRINHLKE